MKKNNYIIISIIVIALAVLIFAYYAYKPKSIVLESKEIRDYQGERLDSVNDFRENSIKGPQYINISNYKLEVSGLVENPKNYSYEEVIKKQNYEKVLTLYCVEGWDVKLLWRGVLIKDLFKDVKPMEGATTAIFYAYDGYSTEFPIDYLVNNNIILAYEMNNATIPPERGFPFMVAAESKWGYKWIKWVTKIELSNDTSYEGYWESRGYAKEGNLNESFF